MSRSFLLSKRAEAQGHDVHIFSLGNYPGVHVVAGMNSQGFPLAVKTFYRWLDLMDEDQRYDDEEFTLREITLVRVDVLSYCVATVGSSLPRDSSENMKPGLYGPFYLDGRPYDGGIGINFLARSFTETAAFLDSDTRAKTISAPLPSRHNVIPNTLIESASRRDNGVCCITGRADVPTSTVWVFPPMMTMFTNEEIDVDKCRTVDNIVTMNSELAEAFNRNEFTVDVDDNNRIIQFNNTAEHVLPAHLTFMTASYDFWRQSLKWSLLTYFPGTDVRDDYPNTEPTRLMEALDDKEADLDDEVWSSGIGMEALEQWRLEQELEEDSSDEDSS
ncbi:hypothetical protein C8R45DRAFT_961774 [Mycena sanguinolenta]|nr:hypothetical protein C8R45DRAFT_961774 [Mycena sanguinolenta]